MSALTKLSGLDFVQNERQTEIIQRILMNRQAWPDRVKGWRDEYDGELIFMVDNDPTSLLYATPFKNQMAGVSFILIDEMGDEELMSEMQFAPKNRDEKIVCLFLRAMETAVSLVRMKRGAARRLTEETK